MQELFRLILLSLSFSAMIGSSCPDLLPLQEKPLVVEGLVLAINPDSKRGGRLRRHDGLRLGTYSNYPHSTASRQ
ncbi:hypothetical protein GQ44DRAFT_719877 [Phaeosphaeriaceae sp. PMI808]|nr:hypothetical protein GQ44DRAFT_719877 [Phaeosphaeriaceae sp. PMI808]